MTRAEKIDKQIEVAYGEVGEGVQIDIFDIAKVFAVGRRAILEGRDLKAAIAEFLSKIRKN
jgi:hypothetical protein